MITLISHFYNEELLLPYWLAHHRRMFDRIILIDYDSNDHSREIIGQFSEIEVRTSRNRVFAADQVDMEVMEIERELVGWKVALTTTEFLVGPIRESLERRTKGIRPCSINLIDRPEDYCRALNDRPLLEQRQYGMVSDCSYQSRLIHPFLDGRYDVGRHNTSQPWDYEPNLFVARAQFSPWPQAMCRKLQIQSRIPMEHFDRGWGIQHRTSASEFEHSWRGLAKNVSHLPTVNQAYADALKASLDIHDKVVKLAAHK